MMQTDPKDTEETLEAGGASAEASAHAAGNPDEDPARPDPAHAGDPAETAADEASAEDDDAAALKDQLLRALADTENVRRRAKKDVEDARRYAIADFSRDLLGVADNMDRALQSIPAEARAENEAVGAIAEGVEMTARELAAVFERHGIEKIEPMGEKFDYNRHQALFESADTDQPDGTIIQVAQVGYMIGERLLRAAMVGVAKGGRAAGDTEGAGDAAAVGGRVDTSA